MTKLDWNRPRRLPRRGHFTAKFSSICRLCNRPINPGDRCTYYNDRAVHARCAE